MIITHELAQRIVDATMAIVQRNVNIMDNRGIIIGSGHRHRLFTYHKGADDVIKSGETVEIRPDQVDHFPGAKEGVNMPIKINDRVVGVVGVFGDPDEVRDIAKLVRMAVELLLEREALREQVQSQYRVREQFMREVLSDKALQDPDAIIEWGHLLGYDMLLPRVVTIVDIAGLLIRLKAVCSEADLVASRTRERVLDLLGSSQTLTSQDISAYLSDTRLVILKAIGTPEQRAVDELRRWALKLHQIMIDAFGGHGVNVAIGSLHLNPGGLKASYQEALAILRLGQLSQTDTARQVQFIYDPDILANYLMGEIDETTLAHFVDPIADRLFRKKPGQQLDLLRTAKALIDTNMNIARASRNLYIHRNTLIFRLAKIRELTGLEPAKNLNHAILLKLAVERFDRMCPPSAGDAAKA
ncbi:MAG TPA: sugar diacid recognition domain protein [Firmicutes bacterium]|nr:sugar diacid recognition domain protein [Bacillota bacterium]